MWEQVNLGYSLKNIPVPSSNAYLKTLIMQTEKLLKRMRFKAFAFEHPEKMKHMNTYGFRTSRTPEQNEYLIPFENDICEMIRTLEFKRSPNNFLGQLARDRKKIQESDSLIISADKTTNLYKIDKTEYNKLLIENTTKTYKKVSDSLVKKINSEAKHIATSLDLSDRIETIAKNPPFLTIKDHKENFMTNPKCRLINPTKSEIGIVSKQLVENINRNIRHVTKLNQWQKTSDVISWFKNLDNKKYSKFIKYDICDFYPSISEELLNKSIQFAKSYTKVPDDVVEIIFHSRKSILFCDNNTWAKINEPNFDVTQGSFDGAEVCELVGLYLLHLLTTNLPNFNTGLYRDDGLGCISNLPGPKMDKMRKDIIKIFKSCGLTITIDIDLTSTDFLDVQLDLKRNVYLPYSKPNNTPLYINKNSNHPPSVIRQIPSMIEHRLSSLSSNQQLFTQTKPTYEQALTNSGFTDKLQFRETKVNKQGKNRKRKITWYNPPYSSSVKTSIGKQFEKLIQKHFPKHHRYHKLFNKNNLKLSYSCMPNMKKIIDNHNKKILNDKNSEKVEKSCNCKNRDKCPLDGKCLSQCIIYKATVETGNNNKFYLGCCEGPFKSRFANHTKSFKHKLYAKETELSKYIWTLKEKNVNFDLKWEIAAKSAPYNCGTRKCDLCLTEKLLISRADPAKMLNARAEIISKCRHRNKYILQNFKT